MEISRTCDASFGWRSVFSRNVRGEVKRITKRTRGVSTEVVYYDLRNYLRGALNYYLIGVTFREVRELDGWIRRRMRLYYWIA